MQRARSVMYPTISTTEGRRWTRDGIRINMGKSGDDLNIKGDLQQVVVSKPEEEVLSVKSLAEDAGSLKTDEEGTVKEVVQETKEETLINGIVHMIKQMMNRRQVAMSVVSMVLGVFSLYMGAYRDISGLGYTDIHENAHMLMDIMLLYGALQITLSLTFFLTCTVTSVAVRKGQNRGIQIITGLCGSLIYLALLLATVVVGIVAFYRLMQMYSHVQYSETDAPSYVDQTLYRCALTVFSFHIWFSVSKCCCCR